MRDEGVNSPEAEAVCVDSFFKKSSKEGEERG